MWYLDACTVVRAQDAGLLKEFLDAAQGLGCGVAEEVYLELCGRPPKAPLQEQRAVRAELSARGIQGVGIPLGSPAAVTYAQLRAGRTGTSDAGECQSIALAVHDPSALFATAETRAGWLALIEIQDRARALPTLLHAMVQDGHLSGTSAARIMATAQNRSRVRTPSWWPY